MSGTPRVSVTRALVVTNMWPKDDDPAFGVFVRDQVEALRARIVEAAPSDGAGVAATDTGTSDIGAVDARRSVARFSDVRATEIRAIDVCVIDGRRNRLAYAFGVLRLRRMLARSDRRYVLVHAHHALAGFAAILAGARRPDRPLIVTHHGIEVLEGWQAPLCRWVSARADRTLVTSPALAERLGGTTRSGLATIDIVPCGVDRRRFLPGDRAAARAQLGLPSNGALVAWVGTDRPEKRLWLARAAVDDVVSDRDPHARLLVISGRPHAEVPTWLQAADVLVLTSTAEGSPLVVREALACGLPVVSTDVGDVRTLLAGLPGCAVVTLSTSTLSASSTARTLKESTASTLTPSLRRSTPPPAAHIEDSPLASSIARGLERALAFGATGAKVEAEAALAAYDSDAIADRVWTIWREATQGADKSGRSDGSRGAEGVSGSDGSQGAGA